MKTTIAINPKTRDLLREYGKKSETYDDVIKRMHTEIKIRDKVIEYNSPDQWVTVEDALEWTDRKIIEDAKK